MTPPGTFEGGPDRPSMGGGLRCRAGRRATLSWFPFVGLSGDKVFSGTLLCPFCMFLCDADLTHRHVPLAGFVTTGAAIVPFLVPAPSPENPEVPLVPWAGAHPRDWPAAPDLLSGVPPHSRWAWGRPVSLSSFETCRPCPCPAASSVARNRILGCGRTTSMLWISTAIALMGHCLGWARLAWLWLVVVVGWVLLSAQYREYEEGQSRFPRSSEAACLLVPLDWHSSRCQP